MIQSLSDPVTQWSSHSVIQSLNDPSHSVIHSYSHPVTQSLSDPVIQWFGHSVIQSLTSFAGSSVVRVLSSVTSDHFKTSIVPLEGESNFQNMSTGLNELQNTMDFTFFLFLRQFHSGKVKKNGMREKFVKLRNWHFGLDIYTKIVKIGFYHTFGQNVKINRHQNIQDMYPKIPYEWIYC